MASFPLNRPIVPTIASMALSRASVPSRAFTIRSTSEAMASARSDSLISCSSAACFTSGSLRYRDNTRLRVETRRDHRGLEPKSKRENRLCATGDTQGQGPPTPKTRIGTDTERHKRTNICIYDNKTTKKKLQTHKGRGSVTTEQAGEQVSMPVRYNAERDTTEVLPEAHGRSSKQREPPQKPAHTKLWS